MFVLARYSRAEGTAPFYTSSGLAYLRVHVVLPLSPTARSGPSRWHSISTCPQGFSSLLALCHICGSSQGGYHPPESGPDLVSAAISHTRNRLAPSLSHRGPTTGFSRSWALAALRSFRLAWSTVLPSRGGYSVRRLPIPRYTLSCTPCIAGHLPPPFRPGPRYHYVAPRSILGVFYGIMCTALRPTSAQLVSSSGVAAF